MENILCRIYTNQGNPVLLMIIDTDNFLISVVTYVGLVRQCSWTRILYPKYPASTALVV